MNDLSQRRRSGNPYASLGDESEFYRLDSADIKALRGGDKKSQYSFEEIEEITTQLQRLLWKKRDTLFGEREVMPILNPANVFKKLGFQLEYETGLGLHNGVEVAGTIDQADLMVRISRQFPLAVQNFTLGHELGHAVLHKGTGLHRDRPLDGTRSLGNRMEKEADKFAACFLMPAKQVRKVFTETFSCEQFSLNPGNIYALDPSDRLGLRDKTVSTSKLSLVLASSNFFNTAPIMSLASRFGVSDGAMAIRLDELNLVAV